MVPRSNSSLAETIRVWLVGETKHWDNGGVFRLRDELSQSSDVIQCSLRIDHTGGTVQPVDCTNLSRVVPTVLRSGYGVQIQLKSNTVLSGPFDSLENIGPRHSLQVRLSRPGLDGPMSNGQSDPVETSRSNLHKVSLGDESLIVLGHGGSQVVAHVLRKGKLVDCRLTV